MTLKKTILICLIFLAAGCASATRVYYWERKGTGGERFASDHLKCLQQADYFPYSSKEWFPGAPDLLELRLNLENGGVWANFSPYEGAMPVFVHAKYPSKTVVYWAYYWCMKRAGYTERRPYHAGPMKYK